MGFRELIKKVQDYSGFSNSESKDALELMVESLAVRLGEGERKDFANQLPEELHDIALSVWPSEENSKLDLIAQFMEMEGIAEPRAKQQVMAAWRALEDIISEHDIEHLRDQLPQASTASLIAS